LLVGICERETRGMGDLEIWEWEIWEWETWGKGEWEIWRFGDLGNGRLLERVKMQFLL